MSRWERVEGLIECDVLCVAFFGGGGKVMESNERGLKPKLLKC